MEGTGCPFETKLTVAAGAGAIGGLVQSNSEALLRMGAQVNRVNIPAFMIRLTDGQNLKDLLDQGKPVQVRFSASFNDALALLDLIDSISSFSSRGPSRFGELKPDIAAPGSNIWAPKIGSGDEAMSQSGTSMAGPMVAGAAALMVQRLRDAGLTPPDRPIGYQGGLTPLDVGALLVNYAEPQVWAGSRREGKTVGISRSGAGRMDVYRAARGDLILRAGTIASVNFGFQPQPVPYEEQRTITLRNVSATERRYTLAPHFPVAGDDRAGVRLAVAPSDVTLGPGQTASVALTLSLDPLEMRPWTVRGGTRLLSGSSGALNTAEIDAYVVATEVNELGQPLNGGDVARVPVYILPRAASAIVVEPDPLVVDTHSSAGPVELKNGADGPGRAELFALLGADEVEEDVEPRLNLDLVGVRLGSDAEGKTLVEIAIHTDGVPVIPQESQLQVFLDTTGDGKMDWLVHNVDPGLLLRPARLTGQQALLIRDVTAEQPLAYGAQMVAVAGADVDIFSRITLFQIPAARLGLAADKPVAFEAIVRAMPYWPDVRGDERTYKSFDVLPDDGWDDDGLGPGRLVFDATRLGFGLDRWSVEVGPESEAVVGLSLRPGAATPLDDAVLALFPFNRPEAGDAQLLDIESRLLLPTPTRGPTAPATRTSGPTATVGPTSTPRPSATPAPPGRRVCLPALLRRSGFQR